MRPQETPCRAGDLGIKITSCARRKTWLCRGPGEGTVVDKVSTALRTASDWAMWYESLQVTRVRQCATF